MTLYAWKISEPEQVIAEGISTLPQLEDYLDASDLPRSRSAAQIIAQARSMQSEGQAVYRHHSNHQPWTLVWIRLR